MFKKLAFLDKVRCCIEPHSDFSIEWDSNFEGSVATSKMVMGRMIMKYSSVPRFVFELSKNFNNFDFLNAGQRNEILECEKVSFADSWYTDIASRSKSDAEYFKGMWDGSYVDSEGKRKNWDECSLRCWRESTDMDEIMKSMESKKIRNIEYSGIVDTGSEYKRPIHVLTSPEKETYVSQYWYGVNILRTKEDQTKEVVGDIVGKYGVVVSGALRSLLEKSV